MWFARDCVFQCFAKLSGAETIVEFCPGRKRHSVKCSFLIEQETDSSITLLLNISLSALHRICIRLAILCFFCWKVLCIPQNEVRTARNWVQPLSYWLMKLDSLRFPIFILLWRKEWLAKFLVSCLYFLICHLSLNSVYITFCHVEFFKVYNVKSTVFFFLTLPFKCSA